MRLRCWCEPDRSQPVGETFAQEFALAGTLRDGGGVVHGWLPQPTLLFTHRDTRAPGFAAAAEDARVLGLAPVVRSSGGEAVPLDDGTVCVDLLLPGEQLSLRAAFAELAGVIVAAAGRLGLAAAVGRVEGAYCPGDYDIATGGHKFAGIAQRRTKQAIAVHSFVLVEGPGRPRCTVAARIATALTGAGPEPAAALPCPVTSLSEAAGCVIRRQELLEALEAVLMDRLDE